MHPRTEYIQSGVVRRLDVLESLTYQGSVIVPTGDTTVKVSAADTTTGFLQSKIAAGSGISLSIANPGANEQLTISANVVTTDELTKVSANDTTAGYLNGKLVAGTGITLTENNNGGNETLTIASSGGIGGTNYIYVAASGTDTDNAASLQAAYNAAKLMSPASTKRIVIVAAPGNYNFGSTAFTMDTQYIDLVPLDGNRSIIFNSSNANGTISITANDVFVQGVDVQTKAFAVATALNLLRVDNCAGGNYSFMGGSGTVPGTYTRCKGGNYSFGGSGVATCTGVFIDCVGGFECFGVMGANNGGVFTNCVAGASSYGFLAASHGSAVYTNCVGGNNSWMNSAYAGIVNVRLYNCRLTSGSFPTVSTARIYNSVDGNGNLIGSANGYASSLSTTSPNNTVNASRWLVEATSTNADAVIQPKGTGAFQLQLADNTVTGGNKRGQNAVDLQTSRDSAAQVASGAFSGVFCGDRNTASGQNSAVLSGTLNTATGQNSAIGSGSQNTVAGRGSFVVGSSNSVTTNSEYSFTWGGDNVTPPSNQNDASNSMVGGRSCRATGAATYSIVTGWHAIGSTHGVRVHSAGRFATSGDCQHERYLMRIETTGSVSTEITANGSAPSSSNRILIASDSTCTFSALVTARRTDADNESAGYRIEGVIDNNAGTTAFVGTPTVTVLAEDTPAWDVTVTADNTNDALVFTVTGEVGKTIRWGAVVELMKVSG